MTLAESASRVPAIVWRRLTDGSAPPAAGESIELQGAVLLADVTGFTALATRLALQGDAGAELLSGVLDDYFGRLISLVAAYGGEPVKMEGDALLVLWPAPDGDCSLATRRAAACAMAIQDRPHRHDAGHWANLSLRVSVAQGRVTGAHLFSGERWHVVLGGAAIDAVIAAQAGARAGDAVASPCAWALLGAHARGVALDAGAWRLGAVEAAPLPTPPALSWPPSALRGVDAYIAAPMRARFAAGHGAWLAELRQVSVMFMRWENLDIRAAGWPARLQGAVDIVVAVIARCEGFLKEIAVDDKGCYAVILFGVPPFSHEDDAVRNVRAALALQHALQATGLDASIGLASGCCFCGLIGSEVRRDYAVIGDAMNVAARLMAAARELPGAPRILSDRPTWRRAEGRVAFERLGAVTVKGKTEPVEVARPVSASDPRPGMAATATVGRVAELATLRTTLAQVANAQARTTTLTIAGEAGMGKSRLAAELTTMAREMGVTVWSGHGDAVETGTVLFPWRHVFAALLGIAAVDAPDRRRAIIEQWLGPALAPRAPLFGALFSLGGDHDTSETAGLSGAARANATCELMVACLDRAARERPTCVLLEDVHWFDPRSWSLVSLVSQRVPRLQLSLTLRPRPQPVHDDERLLQEWAHCATMHVGPLSKDDIGVLACRRIGASTLSESVRAVLDARCGGHPLTAEELASSLVETGAVEIDGSGVCMLAEDVDVRRLAIPKTTQGLLTSRIDHLPPQAQLVLKVASVIGTVVNPRLLHDIHPVPEDLPRLGEMLEVLCEADLMVASQAGGTTVYAFNHVLTLEVAYGLMLYSQRRQLHGAVARWYERLHGDDHPEMLGLLAHHWRCAEDAPRAAACLEKSALRSFSMGFAAAAVDHGLEAAQLLGVRLPRARPGLEQQLQAELQRIQGLLGERRPEQLLDLAPPKDEHANAVIGLLLRMEPAVHVSGQGVLFALIALRCMTLTLENGNGPEAPLAYAMFSIVHSALVRDSRTAFAFSRMALDLDKRQGGRLFVQVAFIHHYFNSHWLQPIDEGAEEVGRAADLGFANGDLLYACFNNSAEVICLAYAGRPLAEVMRLARRNEKRNGRRVLNAAFHCVLQLQFAKAMAGRTTGPLSLSDDEYDEQRELASARSSELHEEAGWYCVAKCRLCYLLGDFPAALQFARDAEPFLPVIARQPAGPELAVVQALTLLALASTTPDPSQAAARLAWLDEARELVAQIRGWAQAGPRSFQHRLDLVEGELARAEGDVERAILAFDAAVRGARALRHLAYEALAHERCAALLASRGDARARCSFAAARRAYAEWGADALVAKLDAQALHQAP